MSILTSVLTEMTEKVRQAGRTGNPKLAIDAFYMIIAPSDSTAKPTIVPNEVCEKEAAEAESATYVWLPSFRDTCEAASLLIRREILKNPKIKPADIPPFPKGYNSIELCQWFVDAECYSYKPTVAPAERKPEDSAPAQIINIKNFKGVLGDVQAENVQTGDYPSIHNHVVTAEKKKRIIRKLLKIIVAFIAFLATLLTTLHLLGWLEPIKEFVVKILSPK